MLRGGKVAVWNNEFQMPFYCLGIHAPGENGLTGFPGHLEPAVWSSGSYESCFLRIDGMRLKIDTQKGGGRNYKHTTNRHTSLNFDQNLKM